MSDDARTVVTAALHPGCVSRREFVSVLAAAAGGAFLPTGMVGALAPVAIAALDLVDVHHHIWPPAYMNKARDRVVAQAQGYLP